MKILQHIKPILFCFFIIVFCSTCKKDTEPDVPTGPMKLLLTTNEIMPYQVVLVQMPDGSQPTEPGKEKVTVQIGDTSIIAGRFFSEELDNTFGKNAYYFYQFIMKPVKEGNYKLHIDDFSTRSCEIDITVKPLPNIPDPDAYVKAYTDELDVQFAAQAKKFDDKVKDSVYTQAQADSIKAFIKACYDKIPTFSQGLTADEKQQYVYLLDANKELLNNYNIVANEFPMRQGFYKYEECFPLYKEFRELERRAYLMDVIIDEDAYELSQEKYTLWKQCDAYNDNIRRLNFNAYMKVLGNAYDEASSTYTWYYPKSFFSFIGTLVNSVSEGIAQEKESQATAAAPFGLKSVYDVRQKNASASFTNGKESKFTVGVELVNLNKESASYIPGFSQIISGKSFFNSMMQKFSKYLPFNVKSDIPAPVTKKVFTAGYEIDQVSDSRITFEIIRDADKQRVKFSIDSTIAAETIPFTFRVKVNTRYGSAQQIVEAELYNKVPATVTDIDGNIYNTIKIGNQYWLKENLKTRTFRNGVDIRYHHYSVSTESVVRFESDLWQKADQTQTPLLFIMQGGYYYNMYAATSSNGLCPKGWHIPSVSEWQTLTNYLGTSAGKKLMTPTTGFWSWNDYSTWNKNASNSSGFSALPYGYESSNLGSAYATIATQFWSTTKSSGNTGNFFVIDENGNFTIDQSETVEGKSCRCIHD